MEKNFLDKTGLSYFYSGIKKKFNNYLPLTGGKITGSIEAESFVGNADTATKLKNPVTINGVEFDGSENISIEVGSNGHLILNSSGASMAVRSKLRFNHSTVTDDEEQDTTIITPIDTTYSVATISQNGLMSSGDKTKLNGIETGATANNASTTTPKANGTASVGTDEGFARGDHVHPLQTTVSGNAGTATKLQTARTIALSGAISGSVTFDGSTDKTITTTLNNFDASKITSGTIDIARLPAAALERCVVVANDTARFALTTNDVQLGDTVKVTETNRMYMITNTSELDTENGYTEFSAGHAATAETATKASQLATSRTINGTSFDGTTNITTANWGTSRNIGIVNSDGTGTAVVTSVNGSNNVNLKLPATIKATLSGNASTATQLYYTLNNPTSAGVVAYVPFVTTASSSNKTTYVNDGISCSVLEGTTSKLGYGTLTLGSVIASGQDGNQYGKIRLYSQNTGYIDVISENSTSNYTLTLPASTTTLVGVSTTQSLTNKTYNGLTLTENTSGFTIKGGSTTERTLTVNASYTLGAACAKGVDTAIQLETASTNLPTSAAVAELMLSFFARMYPVGSIYMSTINTNPSEYFGGTWVSWGSGKVPVGVDAADSDFGTVEKTGGEKTHVLIEKEMPTHRHHSASKPDSSNTSDIDYNHTIAYYATSSFTDLPYSLRNGRAEGYVGATTYSGESLAHNNLQPYITCYMWKRTA